MAATTSEGAVAPSTDLHVKGSPGAKQVGNPTAIMEVKKELFLNGNEAPADIQQVSCWFSHPGRCSSFILAAQVLGHDYFYLLDHITFS